MAEIPTQKVIKLDCYGIEITLGVVDPRGPGSQTAHNGGTIKSELKEGGDGQNELYAAAIDGLESLILGLAVAGENVETDAFARAVETAVDAISNNYDD